MQKRSWIVAAAVLGTSSLVALAPMAQASAPRSALIAAPHVVGGFVVKYAGAAAQTDEALTASCAFVVVGVPSYTNARCRLHDLSSDRSWKVPQTVSGIATSEASTVWAATPLGVVRVMAYADDLANVPDVAGDYELCIQADVGGVLGPEVCSAIS